jgi:predicted phosphodiesterase
VRYSTDLSYAQVVTASSRIADVAASPPYDRYTVFAAEIGGLLPDTTYHYQIYSGGTALLPAEDMTFRTAPDPATADPFTFLVVGDSGTGSSAQKELRDRMMEQPADLILHVGDIAYSSGTYDQFEAYVFSVYQPLFAHLPFFPTSGNHDYRTDHAAPYLDMFDLPGNAWRAGDRERYYSFDWASVHFVALDTEDPLAEISDAASDDMADWLAADLAATDRFWKVAYLHKPPYSAGAHGGNGTVRQRIVPELEQYGVDLVFAGHEHNYERTYPIRNGQVSTVADGGVVYVITGGGGAALRAVGSGWWTAYAASAYEFTRVDVQGCQLRLRAIGLAGDALDDYSLNRCVAPTPTPCHLSQDLDGNGQVDLADVMLVVSYWNKPAGVPEYDLDADGDVDVVDIMLVAASWGATCGA